MEDRIRPETAKRLSDLLNDPEAMEEMRKKAISMLEEWRRGKGEEENKILGACPHCGGKILEKTKIPYTDNPRVGGPPRPHIHDGYYCNKCGTVFVFVPRTRITDEESS